LARSFSIRTFSFKSVLVVVEKAALMIQTGRQNAITDVEGIVVGHYTDRKAVCGVSVVICEDGAVAGVDVRGSAPGTRETDLLDPVNLVQKVQAVVLSGGSVYGLAAADGVVHWLAEKGCGFPLEDSHVAPIVPAATLFDLGRGDDFVPPIDVSWGRRACETAGPGSVPIGCVGAGTGAFAGGIKGGLGTASVVLESGLIVGALVAVNPLGSLVNPDTGELWEHRLELNGEFGDQGKRKVKLPPPKMASGGNTTIGVIATDAMLTKTEAQKIAQMAHDGMARAIRPAHTMFDGDTIFCLGTGKKMLPEAAGYFASRCAESVSVLGHSAADCMARAIIRGVIAAESLGDMVAFRDLLDR
jgi:L-aminopeptidase/D-esterase-like protein